MSYADSEVLEVKRGSIAKHAPKPAVSNWLERLEHSLMAEDRRTVLKLFEEKSHCRDMLAFAWAVTPLNSGEDIADHLLAHATARSARNFHIPEGRTQPRITTRLGRKVIEAIVCFETETTRCSATLRLPADNPDKAWVFSPCIDEIKGHEEPIGDNRPVGSAYSRNFGGANWEDLRKKEQAYEDRDPSVLIVGGSQFGVTLAARLRLLGIDTLCVEKNPNIGDVWRNRYHSLALHNQVGKNHFPYIPYPPNWPKYISKDMVAGFVEYFAWAMEVNVWTSSTFVGGKYDEAKKRWDARVLREDGTERIFHPRHLVFATGVQGSKKTPAIPGLADFKGEILHTEDYRSGATYHGKNALVVGSGTSGHDAAQDLYSSGAEVKIIQRGSTNVVSVKAAAMSDALYLEEKLPLDDADVFALAPTYELFEQGAKANTVRQKEFDKDLLDGLRAKGFKLDFGPNDAGFQVKLRARHGGYYLNCGCSDLIVNGEVGLLQWGDAERFVDDGLLMKDGRIEKADLVVTATGYHNQEDVIRQLLGPDIADKVGPIWGLSSNGELNNMFVPTPQPGLWFLGGGLSQNRGYTKFTALAIKALELGLA